MGNCRDCKHWGDATAKEGEEYACQAIPDWPQMLAPKPARAWSADGLITKADFGCNLFEPRGDSAPAAPDVIDRRELVSNSVREIAKVKPLSFEEAEQIREIASRYFIAIESRVARKIADFLGTIDALKEPHLGALANAILANAWRKGDK
jgi:hypothetical protein